MKRVCAWCGKVLPTLSDERPDETTHAMCKTCLLRELAALTRPRPRGRVPACQRGLLR